MNKFQKVFVFAEKAEALTELCAGGRQLGEQVTALVCKKENQDKAADCGADQVYRIVGSDAFLMEDYTDTIISLVRSEQPGLILITASRRGKLIAGRLAAALKTSVLTDVTGFIEEGEKFQVTRMVYGGAAVRTEQSTSTPVIVTVGGGTFEALPPEAVPKADLVEVDFVSPENTVKCIEKRVKTVKKTNITAAKKVVGVGRGFARQEDLSMAEELAELIGAELGCTRPLAEGEQWLPKETYIGVSGVMLKPELYIAIGISGQIQHMIGINQAQTVIAINENKAAPVFKQADYGIVGDLYKVVPALIEKIKS